MIASHSSARAVADHPRNMTDEMLRALAQNGGVVMINFYPAYIDEVARAEATAYFERHGETLATIYQKASDQPEARRLLLREHFTNHPAPQTSLDGLLDHFAHAIEVAGPDHVGIGADWDGVASMPVGMEDVSRLPALTRGLLARGFPAETLRKVLGENVLRVLEQAEIVSRAMRAEKRLP